MIKPGKLTALAAIVAVWACATSASAQTAKAVDDRLALMKSNGGALAGITKFYKENQGSMADVEKHLATLQANSTKIASDALWPKGTSANELGSKATGAKPDIWAKPDDFKKAAATYTAELQKFSATIKSGDKAAIDSALGGFGRNACGACHQPFRGKRET
jgi:cytochrome c556